MKAARTDEVLDWRARLRDTATGPERADTVIVDWCDRIFMQFEVESIEPDRPDVDTIAP